MVGDRRGGDLACELAATQPDRFHSLVVIDRGHPAVPDVTGVIADEHCPPVVIDTAVLVSTAAARASQRDVYGDFRLVELPPTRHGAEWTAQLVAEIILRTIG